MCKSQLALDQTIQPHNRYRWFQAQKQPSHGAKTVSKISLQQVTTRTADSSYIPASSRMFKSCSIWLLKHIPPLLTVSVDAAIDTLKTM